MNEFIAKLNGWEKCGLPRGFEEYRLRQKIWFPKKFYFKGKTFIYKAFKQCEERQGDGLDTIYQFYRKKRKRN